MLEGGQLNVDKNRVTVLLLINSILIKKAHEIFVTILSNRAAIQQLSPQSRNGVLEQYNNISRRLQCNLSVLAYLEDSHGNKAPNQPSNRAEFPVILSPPPEMPELRLLYKRLQDLYPEAIEFLKMKIHQMKQQQESQMSPSNMPHAAHNVQGPLVAHVPLGPPRPPRFNQQGHQFQQPQRQELHQQVQFTHPPFSQYNSGQSDTPQLFPTPQATQARGTESNANASKIPVQHHLPQHHSKRLDVSYMGGISPQMMSKEADGIAYNETSNIISSQGGMNKGVLNMLSISPQQILQQQMPLNDLSMEFL